MAAARPSHPSPSPSDRCRSSAGLCTLSLWYYISEAMSYIQLWFLHRNQVSLSCPETQQVRGRPVKLCPIRWDSTEEPRSRAPALLLTQALKRAAVEARASESMRTRITITDTMCITVQKSGDALHFFIVCWEHRESVQGSNIHPSSFT